MLAILFMALIALAVGFIPALLIFRKASIGLSLSLGMAGVILAWALVVLTPLGPWVRVTLNGMPVYPAWAAILAFIAAVAVRALGFTFEPRVETEEEQFRRIRAELARRPPG